MNERGQSLVEAIFVFPLLISGFVILAGIAYAGFAWSWLGYQADQALYCMAEGQNAQVCRSTMFQKAQRFLPWGHLAGVDLHRDGASTWSCRWTWNWKEVRWTQTKILKMGFALMALIVSLPVVLSILAVLSLVLLLLYQKTATDRICKVEVMRLQHDLGRLLTELTKLNRPAERLRVQRSQADARLAESLASANPVLIAAAEANQAAVIAEQEALASEQKAILAEANLERLDSERRLQAQQGRFGLGSITAPPDHSENLAVRTQPALSLTPDYVPTDSFRQEQRQNYKYSFDVFDRVPAWLQQVLKNLQLDRRWRRLGANCAATLTQEGQWRAVLMGNP